MRLKLLAPFTIDGFDLNASQILQSPRQYEEAWDEVANDLNVDVSNVPGINNPDVTACRLTHASVFCQRVGSRYRTIDTHSLPRPLHAIELEISPATDTVTDWLQRALTSVEHHARHVDRSTACQIADDLVQAIRDSSPPRGLVRIFDHGIAILEIDLVVPPSIVQQASDGKGKEACQKSLDAIQQIGIEFAETMVDEMTREVLHPFLNWLNDQRALRGVYLRQLAKPDENGTSRTDSRALWVTRSLLFADSRDELTAAGRDGLINHWLKDVAGNDTTVACRREEDAHSTRWLNYLFREKACQGVDGYPSHGWRYWTLSLQDQRAARAISDSAGLAPEHQTKYDDRKRARPFSPSWDAMLIAQYYYAAFDHLQSTISRILAIAVAGEGSRRISTVKSLLDEAVRQANMLKLEYEENRKYYAHKVASEVDEILEGWGFEEGLRKQIDERLGDCEKRLNELHARAMERSSVYTDLILLAIGITAIFEVLLYLAEYGRTMTTDPTLYQYDRTSAWNIAGWIGASSTDAILIAGAVFSVGLTLLYAWFRTSKSRV